VSPGDTLLIDTGSTTLAMAEELAEIDDITVVTNSTAIARVISSTNQSAQVYLLGGAYHEDNRQTFGVMAINQLNGFHGNLSIITVGAVAAGVGVMDYNAAEAEIAGAMIARSDRTVILADASKFDRVAPFVVASFDGIDNLVCDRAPKAALAASLEQAGVKVDF
jgi:DeoR family glycerol-3-phosphate regulon repressor